MILVGRLQYNVWYIKHTKKLQMYDTAMRLGASISCEIPLFQY